jgi:tRNA pseudouridine38-40 synthase
LTFGALQSTFSAAMVVGDKKRVAFTVHYDGAPFFGWQLQRGQVSVQGELERVLSTLFATPTRVVGSGRTDRGVHSLGQVAAADIPARWVPGDLRRSMNALLPSSVWIAHLAEVPPRFHPRYDAVSRAYLYRVGTSEQSRSPFLSPWCWPLGQQIDLPTMEFAAHALIGNHSFRAFAKSGQEERGDRCEVTEARWVPGSDLGLHFDQRESFSASYGTLSGGDYGGDRPR